MVQNPDGWVRDHSRDENHEVAIFTATLGHLNSISADGEDESLERPLGVLVDRVLLDHGIKQVDEFTRPMLLRGILARIERRCGSPTKKRCRRL